MSEASGVHVDGLEQIMEVCSGTREIFDQLIAEAGIPGVAGSCLHASILLQINLDGFCGTRTRVCGGEGEDEGDCGALDSAGRWRGHYWVEGVTCAGEGFVADITADQFGWPPVVLMPLASARDRYRRRDDDLVDEVVQEELVKMAEGRNG